MAFLFVHLSVSRLCSQPDVRFFCISLGVLERVLLVVKLLGFRRSLGQYLFDGIRFLVLCDGCAILLVSSFCIHDRGLLPLNKAG